MFRSILIGLVAGQRAMTPLAAAAGAARRGTIASDAPGAGLLARPAVAALAVALAAGEMAGDKMPAAPPRTVLPGLIGRGVNAAFVGAAFAPRQRRIAAALVAATTAVASAHLGLALRRRAIRRIGPVASGFAEDALVLAGGLALARR